MPFPIRCFALWSQPRDPCARVLHNLFELSSPQEVREVGGADTGVAAEPVCLIGCELMTDGIKPPGAEVSELLQGRTQRSSHVDVHRPFFGLVQVFVQLPANHVPEKRRPRQAQLPVTEHLGVPLDPLDDAHRPASPAPSKNEDIPRFAYDAPLRHVEDGPSGEKFRGVR